MAQHGSQYSQQNGIPRFRPNIEHKGATTTPEWMVQIDEYLSSTIEGTAENPLPEGAGPIDFTICAELFGWRDEQARLTKASTASQLFSSASVQQSTVGIIIPSASYIPNLEQLMYTGGNIREIHLVRLGNIEQLNVPLQIISYTTSKIETLQQELDEMILYFRPATRQNTNYKYSQEGLLEGQNVSSFDFIRGTSTFEPGT